MKAHVLAAWTAGAFGVVLGAVPAAARAQSCEALTGAEIGGGKITSAVAVEKGSLQEIGAFGAPPLPAGRSYCRVQATLSPAPGSSIRTEVWLPPSAEWNGKYLASGNAGFGGTLGPPRLTMRVAVRRGYAVAGTNLGHDEDGTSGENAGWALNQPQKIIDFGYRANHLTAQFAKAVIARYYGAGPKQSYFQGCSDGGREALMEVQRYPDDYDGVIAGAPANAWIDLMTAFAWSWKSGHSTPERLIPDAKLAVVQAAALKACDELDGVKDGIIADPRQCRFDPAVLACKSGDAADCLTPPQLAALRAIYEGPRNPRTGASLFPGFPAGTETAGWPLWITGDKAQQPGFARSFFANFVFDDASWTLNRFDFDRDIAKARKRWGDVLASDKTDLSAFRARGGKLILYHGWADPAITPYSTIRYYQGVEAKMGEKAMSSFTRLFMAPGLGHCLGGPGPNTFDTLAALEAWVEDGKAPETIVATKYANDLASLLDFPPGKALRSRPLCAWPKQARFTGQGSPDEAANYECRA